MATEPDGNPNDPWSYVKFDTSIVSNSRSLGSIYREITSYTAHMVRFLALKYIIGKLCG